MNAPAGKPRIALVAFSSLGDGLIYLMMAENLRLNGFAVTYFGNIGYQLRALATTVRDPPVSGGRGDGRRALRVSIWSS